MPEGTHPPSDHLLRTLAAVPVDSRVLHIGCADRKTTEQLARLGFDLYSCDVDAEAVIAARRRLRELGIAAGKENAEDRIVSATATSLSFPDNFFDWVVAHDVYSRAAASENVVEMVQETRRVLKPGGWVHCAVRAHTEQHETWMQQDPLVYQQGSQIGAFFTSDDLDTLMEELEFAEAKEAFATAVGETKYLCAIYRKVDENTPV